MTYSNDERAKWRERLQAHPAALAVRGAGFEPAGEHDLLFNQRLE